MKVKNMDTRKNNMQDLPHTNGGAIMATEPQKIVESTADSPVEVTPQNQTLSFTTKGTKLPLPIHHTGWQNAAPL